MLKLNIKILTTLLKHDSGTALVNGFGVAKKPDTGIRQAIYTWTAKTRAMLRSQYLAIEKSLLQFK